MSAQGEIDIARTADVSIVVSAPGSGDDVQTLKAGIMEIADVFVVNKSDRDGADRAIGEIQAMLQLQEFAEGAWRPPVLKTQATTGDGVQAVLEAVHRFEDRNIDTRERRRTRARFRLVKILRDRFISRLEADQETRGALVDAVDRVADGKIDPYSAAEEIMGRVQ